MMMLDTLSVYRSPARTHTHTHTHTQIPTHTHTFRFHSLLFLSPFSFILLSVSVQLSCLLIVSKIFCCPFRLLVLPSLFAICFVCLLFVGNSFDFQICLLRKIEVLSYRPEGMIFFSEVRPLFVYLGFGFVFFFFFFFNSAPLFVLVFFVLLSERPVVLKHVCLL